MDSPVAAQPTVRAYVACGVRPAMTAKVLLVVGPLEPERLSAWMLPMRVAPWLPSSAAVRMVDELSVDPLGMHLQARLITRQPAGWLH